MISLLLRRASANQYSLIGPQHACAVEFVDTVDNLGPFGGGELYRTLLTYLDGGGIATFRDDTAEFDDVGPFDPHRRQEQGLEFDEKQRGNNAATLSVTDARKAASNSISSTDSIFDR